MTRSFVHAAQDFYDVKFEMRHLVRVFAVECSAQFVNRVQHSRTVYVLRNGRPHERKISVPLRRRKDPDTSLRVEHRHLFWFR